MIRRPLTLLLAGEPVAAVEAVRRVVDPEPFRLIPAHVALCREEEIAGIPVEVLEARVANGPARRLTLDFGRAEMFDGHGIQVRSVAGGADSQAWRKLG
ncbi:MAG: hypothetical protein ABI639_15345 [Thermoanaerobaculia bacterium]